MDIYILPAIILRQSYLSAQYILMCFVQFSQQIKNIFLYIMNCFLCEIGNDFTLILTSAFDSLRCRLARFPLNRAK